VFERYIKHFFLIKKALSCGSKECFSFTDNDLPVDSATVSYRQYQNYDCIVFNFTYDSVFSDTIPPLSGFVTGKTFAMSPGILAAIDILLQPGKNNPSSRIIEFF
jgi:hypothetical protein